MSKPIWWYVLINPEEYDDSEDKGFATTVLATSEDEAVEFAIAECEASNEWDEGHIDRDVCQTWDVHPDGPRNLKLAVEAYDGDDAGVLRALIKEHLP